MNAWKRFERRQHLMQTGLHYPGRETVKSKGCRGRNKRNTKFICSKFPPYCHRVGNDTVGLEFFQCPADHFIQSQSRISQNMDRTGKIKRNLCLIVRIDCRLPIFIAGNKNGSAFFDFFSKRQIRIVSYLTTASGQFSNNCKGWISMSMGRNAEKSNLIHTIPSLFPDDTVNKDYSSSFRFLISCANSIDSVSGCSG
ncbi:unknown [Clostridium sp. CAG:242]|nr:unknown [Clostridium sp. CAG:242]